MLSSSPLTDFNNHYESSVRKACADNRQFKSAWALASPRFSHGSLYHTSNDNGRASISNSSRQLFSSRTLTSTRTPSKPARRRPRTLCITRKRNMSVTKQHYLPRRMMAHGQVHVLPQRRKLEDRDEVDCDMEYCKKERGEERRRSRDPHAYIIDHQRSIPVKAYIHNIEAEPSPLSIDNEFDFTPTSSQSSSLQSPQSTPSSFKSHHSCSPHSLTSTADRSKSLQLQAIDLVDCEQSREIIDNCRLKQHKEQENSLGNKNFFPEEIEEDENTMTSDVTDNASNSTGAPFNSPPPLPFSPLPSPWASFRLSGISKEGGLQQLRDFGGEENDTVDRDESNTQKIRSVSIIVHQHQQQQLFDLSKFRLESKIDDLKIQLKSKAHRINELIKLNEEQEQTINRERNLRVQAELRLTPACISSETITDITVSTNAEQENQINLFCNSLCNIAKTGLNAQNMNTITDSSRQKIIEFMNDPTKGDDEYKYARMEGAIRKLFEVQQEEISKLKALNEDILQSNMKNENERNTNVANTSVKQSFSLYQMKQEVDSVRRELREMQNSTKKAIESCTKAIMQSIARIKAYVKEELNELDSIRSYCIVLETKLREAFQEIKRLRMIGTSKAIKYFDSRTIGPKQEDIITPTNTGDPSPVPTLESWYEFTRRFRQAISSRWDVSKVSDKTPGYTTKMVEKLFQELSFNSSSNSISELSSTEMVCNDNVEKEHHDEFSDTEIFKDAVTFIRPVTK